MPRKPNFIGLGVQRAGTSWIHNCLYEHPQIYMPPEKEISFFNYYYSKGPEWYTNCFRACGPDQLAGEISPDYLCTMEAAERIYNWNPELKFIISLRNPVERAVSAYRYFVNRGDIPRHKSFNEVVSDRPGFVKRGFYHEQIWHYLKYFSKEQILILIYEDIASDPYQFIQHIYRFLGVDPSFRPSVAQQKINVSQISPRHRLLYTLGRMVAKSLRGIRMDHVVWKITRSRLATLAQPLYARTVEIQPLSRAQRLELQKLFTPDVQALENLLQRDLRRIWFPY